MHVEGAAVGESSTALHPRGCSDKAPTLAFAFSTLSRRPGFDMTNCVQLSSTNVNAHEFGATGLATTVKLAEGLRAARRCGWTGAGAKIGPELEGGPRKADGAK